MKIGYPVINLALGHISSHTFRLALLNEEKLFKAIDENLDSLEETLKWNVSNNLLFYRISSGLIPFASHKQMDIPWQEKYKERLGRVGRDIKNNNIRISMHPGQFVVLNSPNDSTYQNSVKELEYHAELLNLMGLDRTHKFQIHFGGVHNDREKSTEIFTNRYLQLPQFVRDRLVIENDERTASLRDCIRLYEKCGIPILFDTFHHEINNNGETVLKGLQQAKFTWKDEDGVQMIDYSNANPDKRAGAHSVTIDVEKFRGFIKSLRGRDVDIMLEVKNKEASAMQARVVLDTLL